jgi:uncharacterized repeat protein (TIGR03803 family)
VKHRLDFLVDLHEDPYSSLFRFPQRLYSGPTNSKHSSYKIQEEKVMVSRFKRSHAAVRAVAVAIVATFVVASSWATEQPVLQFTGANGSGPQASLISDAAGNLYGTAMTGGPSNGGGIVFKLVPTKSGWQQRILHTFRGPNDGAYPAGTLIFDSAGNLYGTTSIGGGSANCDGGCGTVFRLSRTPAGVWEETILHRFRGLHDGSNPVTAVVFDTHGNLYGATSRGGTGLRGIAFKLAPTSSGTWTETILHTFLGINGDGSMPMGDLTIDAAGNLYGTTYQGGAGGGVVFELSPGTTTWTEKILYTFGNDAAFPTAGLVWDVTGDLFGTTTSGGSGGAVFELTPSSGGTWTKSILYSFQGGSDGAKPYAPLIFDGAGNLYGTTKAGGGGTSCAPQSGGCGTVFQLTPSGSTWSENVLTTFTTQASSGYPLGGVTFGLGGNLYGTTSINGVGNTASGQVFEVTP